jgi:hypothetical protein
MLEEHYIQQPQITSCVHFKKEQFDVYIGRPSPYENPFSHKDGTLAKFRVGSRAEAIASFRAWAPKQPGFIEKVKYLRGKRLGCWCHPLACHGDVWVDFCNMSDFALELL